MIAVLFRHATLPVPEFDPGAPAGTSSAWQQQQALPLLEVGPGDAGAVAAAAAGVAARRALLQALGSGGGAFTLSVGSRAASFANRADLSNLVGLPFLLSYTLTADGRFCGALQVRAPTAAAPHASAPPGAGSCMAQGQVQSVGPARCAPTAAKHLPWC